jgi:hypothetical protein
VYQECSGRANIQLDWNHLEEGKLPLGLTEGVGKIRPAITSLAQLHPRLFIPWNFAGRGACLV